MTEKDENINPGQILVVDDTMLNLRLLTDILSSQGYTVHTANNGTRALVAIAEKKPELILLDINMPDMDGYEVCRRLKADETSRRIPVIFISALDDVADKVKGFNVGGVDYITKPFQAEEVLARVKTHLSMCRMQEYIETQNSQLQQVNAEIEQLFLSIPSIMISITDAGAVAKWNPGAEKALGITVNEAVGQDLNQLPIRWLWDTINSGIADCRLNGSITELNDFPFTYGDGRPGFLWLKIIPIQNGDALQGGTILFGTDITERRIWENQLIQAQKLESIGQLASGIAHEINTPLQFVGDNTHFLKDSLVDILKALAELKDLMQPDHRLESPEHIYTKLDRIINQADMQFLIKEIPKAIQESLGGIERAAKLIQSLREFSHPGGEKMELTDINRAIENTIVMSRNEWKYVADLVTDLDPQLPDISCFGGDLKQVILNIIINAAHAIADKPSNAAEKGKITIKTSMVDDDLEIRISDTGTGIPDDIKPRIFDPFFTTKGVGRGTGQGLSIAYGIIVKKHGGSISVETQLGYGSTFIIRLPANLR